MSEPLARSAIRTVPEIDGTLIRSACAVMHAAFSVYSRNGLPSGALLESVESLEEERLSGVKIAVVLMGDSVAAMVKYRAAADRSIYFSRLSVAPWAQGNGLARRLVETLRAIADDEGLRGLSCSVRAAEVGNIALYKHLGMVVVGRTNKTSLTGAVIPVVQLVDAN